MSRLTDAAALFAAIPAITADLERMERAQADTASEYRTRIVPRLFEARKALRAEALRLVEQDKTELESLHKLRDAVIAAAREVTSSNDPSIVDWGLLFHLAGGTK